MPKMLPRLSQRIFNTPLLIEPSKLQVILAALSLRLGIAAPSVDDARLQEENKREIYSVTDSGIAVIDICGSLVNRAMGMDAMSGMTSYEEIAEDFLSAVADQAVKGIMLRLCSPGGEAAGLTSLSDMIAACDKPVWAAVDDYAYSAAYWIASAADEIYVTETGGVGSVGVIAEHLDMSEADREEGLKYTTVFAGSHKADFSPHAPLSDEAAKRLQARVDEIYASFVGTVAANREMAKAAVRDTEADCFYGQKAIDIGLADRMGDFRTAMSDMQEMLSTGKRSAPAVHVRRSHEPQKLRQSAEYRTYPITELRADGGDEPKMSGHVAVFGQWSEAVAGFTECVEPGAFTKTLKEADIHHYFNHDSNYVLGRNRSGTLTLREDNAGLFIENSMPNTQLIRDIALEPMRRGDIDQGSFAFLPVRQEWGKKDGVLTRRLLEVRLFHTAVVPKGAYPQTRVGLTGLDASFGLNYQALALIELKAQNGISLSEEDREVLQRSIDTFTRCIQVAPGAKAHPTAPASRSIEHFRRRLELAKRAV